jgi:hypothetical protein
MVKQNISSSDVQIPNGKKKCNICFEFVNNNKVSFCLKCKDSSFSCHECELKWVNFGNNPDVCFICRSEDRKNVSRDNKNKFTERNTQSIVSDRRRDLSSIEIDIESQNPRSNNQDEEINFEDCNSFKKICSWLTIIIVTSWLFAAFSFYVIFDIKKNMILNPHIGLGCGAVVGVPIVILFRKYIKRNCLSN